MASEDNGDLRVVSSFATIPATVLTIAYELRGRLEDHDFSDICSLAMSGEVTKAGKRIMERARRGEFLDTVRQALQKHGFVDAVEKFAAVGDEKTMQAARV